MLIASACGSAGVAHGPRSQTRMGKDATITWQGELSVLKFGLHGDLWVVLERLAYVLVVYLVFLADIQVSLFWAKMVSMHV